MKRKIIAAGLIVSAVIVIIYCGLHIFQTMQERYLSKQEYVHTREEYVSAIKEKGPNNKQENTQTETDGFPDISVDTESLLECNPDYVGWLYYKDAEINYPICQPKTEKEENRYLTTTFQGKSNPSGCIFIDRMSDSAFRSGNTFIYGHNMLNGAMFGTLKKVYQNPEKCKDPYFYIWDKYGHINKYRVIAAYIVNEDSSMYTFEDSDEGYDRYIKVALKLGPYTYVAFTKDENAAMKERKPIVTLSTCYGAAGTRKRLLIQGVEITAKKIASQKSSS